MVSVSGAGLIYYDNLGLWDSGEIAEQWFGFCIHFSLWLNSDFGNEGHAGHPGNTLWRLDLLLRCSLSLPPTHTPTWLPIFTLTLFALAHTPLCLSHRTVGVASSCREELYYSLCVAEVACLKAQYQIRSQLKSPSPPTKVLYNPCALSHFMCICLTLQGSYKYCTLWGISFSFW